MKNFKIKIYSKIILIDIIIALIMSILVPVLANYPPHSEELAFQSQVLKVSHIWHVFAKLEYFLSFICIYGHLNIWDKITKALHTSSFFSTFALHLRCNTTHIRTRIIDYLCKRIKKIGLCNSFSISSYHSYCSQLVIAKSPPYPRSLSPSTLSQ